MASGKRTGSHTSGQDHQPHGNDAESLTEELGSSATQASASVQDAASEVTQNVRQQITSQVSAQQERAVDTLETVALLLQQAGEHARKEEKAAIAQFADQAASQVERLSTAIRDREPDQLLADTKQLAQNQPGLFVGGALLAGFLGARFLRSSALSQSDNATQETTGSTDTRGGGESTGAASSGEAGYGTDVPVATDVTATATAVGSGTTTSVTDPAMMDGTILEEEAVQVEDAEGLGGSGTDAFPDESLETR